MPFNFLSKKHYSINYEELFNELNSNNFLNDEYVQSAYLSRWIEALMNADKIISEELKTKESIMKLSLSLQTEPEIFQIPMYHENITIPIHFRASIANRIIFREEKNKQAHLIDIKEFTKENSAIKWTPVNENVDSYKNAQDPIIMVPFLNGNYNYIVIDGNHRLTYKVHNNINNISAIAIAEQSVIDYSLFSSVFDKLYYIMSNEISHMYNEIYKKNTPAIELVQKSFIKDGKFKF